LSDVHFILSFASHDDCECVSAQSHLKVKYTDNY